MLLARITGKFRCGVSFLNPAYTYGLFSDSLQAPHPDLSRQTLACLMVPVIMRRWVEDKF